MIYKLLPFSCTWKVKLFPSGTTKGLFHQIYKDVQHVPFFCCVIFNIWKNQDHCTFTAGLWWVSPRCYSGIACFVLRANGQAFASAEKQFRYRARVCYCVWGGLRHSVVLGPGRQECRETIRMRHLQLQRLNTKRPAVWQVEMKRFGTVPSLSKHQMGLNFTNGFHAVTWVGGNNGECTTSTLRWDWAHWGQFRWIFISVGVDLLPWQMPLLDRDTDYR